MQYSHQLSGHSVALVVCSDDSVSQVVLVPQHVIYAYHTSASRAFLLNSESAKKKKGKKKKKKHRLGL